MNETRLVIRKGLSLGQQNLFTLICEKTKTDEPITLQNAVDIWTSSVCREIRNGVPHYWWYWDHKNEKDEWVGGFRAMSEAEIRQRSCVWLMTAIGALVLKGHLKIIPQLALQ